MASSKARLIHVQDVYFIIHYLVEGFVIPSVLFDFSRDSKEETAGDWRYVVYLVKTSQHVSLFERLETTTLILNCTKTTFQNDSYGISYT